MRRIFVLISVIAALTAAGCGGATPEPPTITPLPPTETLGPTNAPVPAPLLNLTVQVPVPGTLVPAPGIGTPVSLTVTPFTVSEIIFTRTGGLLNQPLIVIVRADGTGTRDGQPITVSSDVIDDLRGRLDRMAFFALRGQFTSPGASADTFYYSLTVTGSGGTRQVDAQDDLTPPELRDIFTIMSAIGAP